MFERFTEKALQAIMLAQEESRRLGHNFVGTEQIFLGIVGQGSGPGFNTLRAAGVTLRNTRVEVERMIGRGSGFVAVEIPFTPRAKRVLETAMEKARDFEHTYIGTEHLLLGLLEDTDGVATRVMVNLGVDLDRLRAEILDYIGQTKQASFFEDLEEDSNELFITATLGEYIVNLTELAEGNKLDPVVGRQKEIERVIQILSRRRKNNPILIGEPGVGKTAVAEGLAQRIVNQEVPITLQDKKLIQLDVSLLLAGTKYRGEFEDRLKRVIEEIESSEHLIVVIDEVHTLVGAGAAEGAMDAANTLKPALARGQFQCIGATTIEEYRQYIEKDKALERRFQPVYVNEPSIEETIEILKGLRQKYESYHNLTIEDSAIIAAARMGAQYIADRYLPDKAIDLIDEASSRVRLLCYQIPEEAIELDRELRDILNEKNEAVRVQNFELAVRLRNRETELRSQISSIIKAQNLLANSLQTDKVEKGTLIADQPEKVLETVLPETKKQSSTQKEKQKIISQAVLEKKSSPNEEENLGSYYEQPSVTEEDVAYVVSAWSGVPVNKVSKTETQKLIDMEAILQQRVIGQKQAVTSVAKAIRRARIGLRNPNRPIASFLFSGPTGVGKTELSKALASYFFGSEDAMIRLDMSEFMERHTVAKLIGSPPGYVGYSEGGQLTEAVRRKPYTVLLFDEIEKAHPDVFNLLLQILDDGRLTDSKGRTVDFTNTLVIMTSNLGSRSIERTTSEERLGFGINSPTEENHYNKLCSVVNEELKRFFRPEFLNRIDEIIVFQQLTKDEVHEIADIMLNQLKKRMRDQGMILEITRRAKNLIVDEGFDPLYGARPLRRAIMRLIEDKIASNFLTQSPKGEVSVMVDCEENEKEMIVTLASAPSSKLKNNELLEEDFKDDGLSINSLALLSRYALLYK